MPKQPGQSLVAKKRDPKVGVGKCGTKIPLLANHYRVKIPTEGYFYHYDVDMVFSEEHGQGDSKKKGKAKAPAAAVPGKPAEGPTLPKAMKQRAMVVFKQENRAFLNGTKPAYDGEKTLYSVKEFKVPPEIGSYSTIITLPRDEEGGEKKVKVTIQPCQPLRISWKELADAMEGRAAAMPVVVLQCVNTVFREAAVSTETNIAIRRSYYSRFIEDPKPLTGGREIWSGFYSSARPTQWKVMLNLDKSNTAFYKKQPLIEFLSSLLKAEPPKLTLVQRKTFEREVKTLKVETTHGGIRRQRITGVTSETPDKLFFDVDGIQTNVADYFRKVYKITLKHLGLPCLKVGNKGSFLPIELCTLLEQKCDRRMTGEQTAEMVKSCTQTATQRRAAVSNIRTRIVRYDTDPTLKEFGFSVDKNLATVEGRHLEPPVMASSKLKTVSVKGQDGTFDPRNVPFTDPAVLENWVAFVLFDDRQSTVRPFLDEFVNMGQRKGMTISPPDEKRAARLDWRSPDFIKAFRETQQNFAKDNLPLDLIMVFIDKDSHYAEVKKAGDIAVGIVTQVVKGATLKRNMGPKLVQLVSNILLKVNTKLGGTNIQVANFGGGGVISPDKARLLERFTSKPTIIFGADVTHPSPGESKNTPSIAAVVASHNRYFTKYSARVRAQGHRAEIMIDLEEMVRELLIEFRVRNAQNKPQRIMFYRDGVSEGQFRQVMEEELKALQAACKKLEDNYQPEITYIIVGKRHHTRFFCQNDNDRVGRGENVPAGTVVDTGIVHFSEMDYFLCSHGGIQGTSRPAHYNVLYDDADFTADEIELFSYYLTYCYARCNRSVSIPAPAYYAHHVAFRARHHLSDNEGSDTASSLSAPVGGGGSNPRVASMNEKIKVHASLMEQKKIMYFV